MSKKTKKDNTREERIINEIIVDAYDAEEQTVGWFYYLAETISFPFIATCRSKRAISPLRVGDEIEPYAMAPESECNHEMFVMIPWEKDGLAVPLSQLTVVHGDDDTEQAVSDWNYWVDRGYIFG